MDDADSLLAEITGITKVMDDADSPEVLDDDDVRDVQDENAGVVALSNGIPADPQTPDSQFSASVSEPDLHSIPHIQSPPNLTGTPVPVTTPLESDTCESTSINPNKDKGLGGGGIKNVA
jgi:hypothetical protein